MTFCFRQLSLEGSCGRSVSEPSQQFRSYVLQLLCSEYMVVKGTSMAQPGHVALTFINELIGRTIEPSQIAK